MPENLKYKDSNELTRFLFFVSRDWTHNHLTETENTIEEKFAHTVYRCHLASPTLEDLNYARSFEYFTITFDFDKDFRDKQNLH